MTSRFCAMCGAALRPGAAYCAQCGAAVPRDAEAYRLPQHPPPAGPPPLAPPPPLPVFVQPPGPPRPAGRRGVVAALVAGALVLVGGGVAATLLLTRADPDERRPGAGSGDGERSSETGDVSTVERTTIDRGTSVLGEPAREWVLLPGDVAPGATSLQTYYSHEVDQPAVWVLDQTVVVQVGVGDEGETLMAAVDPASGSVLWTTPADDYGRECWVVAEGTRLACEQGYERLELLDPATGDVLATYDEPVSDLLSTPGWIYAVRSDEDQAEGLAGLDVVRLDADDLSVDWEATAPDPGTLEDEGNEFDGGTFLDLADGELSIDYGYLGWSFDSETGELTRQESSHDFPWHSGGYEIETEYGDAGDLTRVRDREGSTLLLAEGSTWSTTGSPSGAVTNGRIGIGPAVYDLTTGGREWSRDDLYDPEDYRSWSWTPDHRHVLVDDPYVEDTEPGTTLLDAGTGDTVWYSETQVGGWNSAFTADAVVTADDSSVLTVRPDDADGVAWTRDLGAIADYEADYQSHRVAVSDEALVVSSYQGLVGFTEFDPDAALAGPDGEDGDGGDGGDGGTTYITDCGSEPELTPVSAEAANGGITVTYEVRATCPGGQWLNGSRQLVSLGTDAATFLSGTYDFSTAPYWVPDAGSGAEPLVLRLVHPFEGAFATVDEISEAIAADLVHVDCVEEPGSEAGEVPADPADGSDPAAPVPATGPGTDDGAPESALAALRRIAAGDEARIDGELAGWWLAQLSSKTRGTTDDGIVYDYDDVLALHLRLRARYGDVVLLNTSDWGSFKTKGLWVTLYARTWDRSPQALFWCQREGWDHGNCYAKRVDRDGPPEGNTDLWPPGDGA